MTEPPGDVWRAVWVEMRQVVMRVDTFASERLPLNARANFPAKRPPRSPPGFRLRFPGRAEQHPPVRREMGRGLTEGQAFGGTSRVPPTRARSRARRLPPVRSGRSPQWRSIPAARYAEATFTFMRSAHPRGRVPHRRRLAWQVAVARWSCFLSPSRDAPASGPRSPRWVTGRRQRGTTRCRMVTC